MWQKGEVGSWNNEETRKPLRDSIARKKKNIERDRSRNVVTLSSPWLPRVWSDCHSFSIT